MTAKVDLWLFPRGMKRDGGVGKDPVQWTSKYGSVITGFYDTVSADGMNETGLVCNLLYQVEADYGDPQPDRAPDHLHRCLAPVRARQFPDRR